MVVQESVDVVKSDESLESVIKQVESRIDDATSLQGKFDVVSEYVSSHKSIPPAIVMSLMVKIAESSYHDGMFDERKYGAQGREFSDAVSKLYMNVHALIIEERNPWCVPIREYIKSEDISVVDLERARSVMGAGKRYSQSLLEQLEKGGKRPDMNPLFNSISDGYFPSSIRNNVSLAFGVMIHCKTKEYVRELESIWNALEFYCTKELEKRVGDK